MNLSQFTFNSDFVMSKRQTPAVSLTRSYPGGKRLRVLRIAHASLTPALRGRERGIAQTYPDIDLEVIAPTKWRESGVDVRAVPDEFFPVRTARTFISKHIQLFAYDPRVFVNALKEHRPHVIDMDHEPYSVPCAEILTLRNIYAPSTPIVMQTAQNINKNYPPPFSYFEQRAFRQVAGAYMCSLTVKEVLTAKGFTKPCRIVPFGVDTEMFSFENRRPKEELTIGFVGRLIPAKGLSVLVEALREIKEQKWRLLIVGDGERREAIEKQLSLYGLLERTTFVGAVPYEETPKYFSEIDMLIVPTRTTKKIREQFGRVIVEAMSSGVPVIGSTCGAIPEVIGDAGLVFSEKDSNELGQKISQLLKDGQLRMNMAQKGRLRVEENYTWSRVAEGITELYATVLATADQKERII